MNCLGLERQGLRDVAITSAELAFYRKEKLEDIERQVKLDRTSVQALIAFDQFYTWAAARPSASKSIPGPSYGQWVTRYPMSGGEWPIDIRVLASMFDPKTFAAWDAAEGAKGFTHSSVLHCKVGEFRAIARELLPELDSGL